MLNVCLLDGRVQQLCSIDSRNHFVSCFIYFSNKKEKGRIKMSYGISLGAESRSFADIANLLLIYFQRKPGWKIMNKEVLRRKGLFFFIRLDLSFFCPAHFILRGLVATAISPIDQVSIFNFFYFCLIAYVTASFIWIVVTKGCYR